MRKETQNLTPKYLAFGFFLQIFAPPIRDLFGYVDTYGKIIKRKDHKCFQDFSLTCVINSVVELTIQGHLSIRGFSFENDCGYDGLKWYLPLLCWEI